MVKQDSNAITFTVRVVPRSSRSEIVGEVDGVLKIKLKAPPVDGAANDELVKLLAKYFNTAQSQVQIVSGFQSRTKTVRVSNLKGNK